MRERERETERLREMAREHMHAGKCRERQGMAMQSKQGKARKMARGTDIERQANHEGDMWMEGAGDRGTETEK